MMGDQATLIEPRAVVAQEPICIVRNLGKRYESQDGGTITALDALSFSIAEGEFVAVVGPSGCGKSTLLHILAGVFHASSGEVVLHGRPVTGPRRDVGVVFQDALLLPWRRVIDNVLLPAIVHRLPIAPARARAMELLHLVQLEGFAEKYPYELSGGMQQRVAIARGLLHDPAILLMDEPFGALDAMTREQMNLDLLDIWQAAQKTAMLITHSISEAVFLADRVLVLSARPGRMIDEVSIELPRPRSLDMMATPEFGALTRRIRTQLGVRG
jgi:NitT/TauT family transport system ATP-binding protein